MSEIQQHKPKDQLRPLDALTWVVCPILPLLGGLWVLQALYDQSAFSFQQYGGNAVFIESAKRGFVHFEGLMVYTSVALVHVTLCVMATAYCSMKIVTLPSSAQKKAWWLIAILAAVLAVMGVIAASTNAPAIALTFHNVCDVLRLANAATHIVSQNCRGSEASMLLWLALVPVIAGSIAAICATGVVAGSVSHTTSQTRACDWKTAFPVTTVILQRMFYIVSAILVTSTVAIMLFLQLPVALTGTDSVIRSAVVSHAQGMTVFWGTVFTLTLLAIFAPAAALLTARAREHEAASTSTSEVSVWLETQIFTSIPKRLGGIVAFLAPLMVGPVSMLLEKLTGSG